jgi:hypothetical protein
MLVATSMRSYAISFYAGPGLEMIRFASAIFKDRPHGSAGASSNPSDIFPSAVVGSLEATIFALSLP